MRKKEKLVDFNRPVEGLTRSVVGDASVVSEGLKVGGISSSGVGGVDFKVRSTGEDKFFKIGVNGVDSYWAILEVQWELCMKIQ